MRRPFVFLLTILFLPALVAGAGATEGGITGTVRDASGGVVVGASVSLQTAGQAVVGSTKTNDRGRFEFPTVRPGRYVMVVSAPGFAETRMAVTPGAGGADGVAVTLAIEGVATTVSVTASQGVVQDVATTGQAVTIVDEVGIEMNAKEVVGQAVAEQTGVHLLRTSPTMAGIYVRGLTGAKVNVFVDGVRYSTSTARGGVNTFLDLIEPTNLQGVEVLRGANSAQYGSDALGGSVQFLSQVPTLAGAGGGRRARDLRSEGRDRQLERRRQRGARLPGRQVRHLRQHRGADRQRHAPRRRNRLARGGHQIPRRVLRQADAGEPARDRLQPLRRLRPRELGADVQPTGHVELQPDAADGRQTIRPTARRRRQPAGRSAGPLAGLLLRKVPAHRPRMVRPGNGQLFVQFAVRGAREPGRQRQSARLDHTRTRTDQRERLPGAGHQAVRDPKRPAHRRRVLP